MITTLTKGQVPLPLNREIHARLVDGCADTFLHIVPTDHARLKWCREYLRGTPNRVVADLHIFSLEYLVRLLYRRLNVGRRRIGAGIQTVWTHEIMEQEPFPFLRSHPDTPVPQGTARQLREAINQLKTGGVDWQQLQTELDSGDADAPDKLADLITLYKSYETRLGSRWVDRADVHRTVSQFLTVNRSRAGRLMKAIFPAVDLVVVSGFDVLSPFDLAILTGISNLPWLKMGVVLDFDAQNESLFGHVKAGYDQFRRCGFEPHDAAETPGAAHRSYFARNLFHTERGESVLTDKLALTEEISLLHPPNRVQEVEEIAKLIKRLVLSQSSPALDQICVTFHRLDTYAPLIREIFPLYGIPYAMEWGERLENSTVVVSIFSLLEQIQGSASPQARRKVLQSPYFQIDDLESVIHDCGLNGELSPQVFRESFNQLMVTLKIDKQILKGSWESKTRFAAHKINAYRQFRRLIDELVDFLTMSAGSEVCYPLRRYINWLRLMVSQATYQWGNPNGDGVRILPLIQTKDLSFDTVLLGGLVDGEFPAVFRVDTFLPAQRRGAESDRLREDRFLFYQVLTLYRKRLYLLSPQHDGDIELVPSAFVDELQRIAEIDSLADDDNTLFSTEHFLKNYGVSVWERPGTKPVAESAVTAPILPMLHLVGHNVCVEKSRTVTGELRQYEGNLLPHLLSDPSRRALERRRKRTYSITQLETYGACPFRYFSNRILSLNVAEEEETELTSLEKGSLAHKILFEFYDSRREEPPISECEDETFQEVVGTLQQIARQHLAEEKAKRGLNRSETLFWDIEAERLIGGHGRAGILPTFLEAERERTFEVHPRYFEVEFGPSNRSAPADPFLGSREPIKVGDVCLSGRIDRVELGNGLFVIGDYKTGRTTPKLNDILEGRSLQLPLYIAVVEQLLERQSSSEQGCDHELESVQGVGGVYYVLQEESRAELGIGDREYNKRAFQAFSQNRQLVPNRWYDVEDTEGNSEFNALRSIVDEAIEYANQYVSSIADGQFQLTQHDKTKVCRYCSFKRICRVGAVVEEPTA